VVSFNDVVVVSQSLAIGAGDVSRSGVAMRRSGDSDIGVLVDGGSGGAEVWRRVVEKKVVVVMLLSGVLCCLLAGF